MKEHIKLFFLDDNIFTKIFIVLMLISFFTYLPYRYITAEKESLEGTVIGLNAIHSDEGSHPYLIVKLDNNQTVTCKIPYSSMYKKDKRISIIKSNTFGFSTYRFNRYIF